MTRVARQDFELAGVSMQPGRLLSFFVEPLTRWVCQQLWSRRLATSMLRSRSSTQLLDDTHAVSRAQRRVLLGLTHGGRRTPFGRDHDLARVREVEDFQRLTPLSTPDDLLARYPTAGTPVVSVWETILGLILQARPHVSLTSGDLLFLGEDGRFPPAETKQPFSWFLKPYVRRLWPANPGEPVFDGPVAFLAGSPDSIERVISWARVQTGKTKLSEVWPGLSAVLYEEPAGDYPSRGASLQAELGTNILVMRVVREGGSIIAVEDPRHGLLRLVPNGDCFFEFIPVKDLAQRQPRRLRLEETTPGERYELVLTSASGWWACRTGKGVEFARTAPPLFRFVPLPEVQPPLEVVQETRQQRQDPAATPIPQPHRRIVGTPAELPGKFDHTPWSTPVGRG